MNWTCNLTAQFTPWYRYRGVNWPDGLHVQFTFCGFFEMDTQSDFPVHPSVLIPRGELARRPKVSPVTLPAKILTGQPPKIQASTSSKHQSKRGKLLGISFQASRFSLQARRAKNGAPRMTGFLSSKHQGLFSRRGICAFFPYRPDFGVPSMDGFLKGQGGQF